MKETPVAQGTPNPSWLGLLNGPHTLGRGGLFWVTALAVLGLAAGWGGMGDPYDVENASYFLVWVFMALGLCVMWGYAGILSFGQTAFFGVAGYGYSVLALNLGGGELTLVALLISVGLAMLSAVILGYFMYYGGVTDVFVAIITLALTLTLEAFLGQTAGPEWAIGSARLNGFNGMTNIPVLSVSWFGGGVELQGRNLYFALLSLVVVVYLGLRVMVNSRFGRVLVAIRENPLRTSTLGFNVPAYQLVAFTIGSTLAGVSGVLYVAWGQYITPSTMGLYASVLPIIWVAVGGRKDLTASLVGTIAVLYLSQTLAVYGSQYAMIVLGAVLLGVVMLAPDGFVMAVMQRFNRRLK